MKYIIKYQTKYKSIQNKPEYIKFDFYGLGKFAWRVDNPEDAQKFNSREAAARKMAKSLLRHKDKSVGDVLKLSRFYSVVPLEIELETFNPESETLQDEVENLVTGSILDN